MITEIVMGMVFLTAPASPVPEQYAVTAFSIPGAELRYRPFDGWIPWTLCYDRCMTTPGQPTKLLNGEFNAWELATLQLTVWRRTPTGWEQQMHCNHFFTGPTCWNPNP